MDEPPRYARSFRPRRRGLSPSRDERYRALLPLWSLPEGRDVLDLDALFARPGADVVLDIGFGGGEGLVELAAVRPDECIIGVEVHTPGVAHVLDAIDEGGWTHVRVAEDDALDLLPRIAPGSLTGVRIWFPDPWLKNRQRHRRLVREQVVPLLVERLRVGGLLHVATDIDDYARQVLEVVAGEPRLAGGVVPRPEWRPLTRFERRGLDAGRDPVDMIFTRES
ncbi:MAG: tRNA ((7)-)-methyltransferase [Actinomycetota bacterium]